MFKLEKKPRKTEAIYISDEVRERWGLMKSEDFEMLNTEYLRQMYLMQNKSTNAIIEIKRWVILFGVLVVLSGIFAVLNFFLQY